MCCSENRSLYCPSSFIETSYAPGRKWVPTPISGRSSASVTLDWSACAGSHVVGLRYAWRETPCPLHRCAIYGAFSELPMPPYINMGLVDDGNMHDLKRQQINLL